MSEMARALLVNNTKLMVFTNRIPSVHAGVRFPDVMRYHQVTIFFTLKVESFIAPLTLILIIIKLFSMEHLFGQASIIPGKFRTVMRVWPQKYRASSIANLEKWGASVSHAGSY